MGRTSRSGCVCDTRTNMNKISLHTVLMTMLVVFAGRGVAAEPGSSSPAKPTSDGVWKAGVAQVDITPSEPVWMAGYGARTNPAAGRLQPLYAKTLALEDAAGKRLVLITTDLVGMRAKFTDGIAEEIKTKHGLARDQLMFTSSHTHTHRLKRELGPSTWVASYANDVMAYIPSLRVLNEGGYEATITSGELAGSGWGSQAEEQIIHKVHELVAQVRGTAENASSRKLRVVVFGAHPDDPETGSGGLIALLAKAGHEVIAAYTTCYRGDRQIGNEPEAVVRRREATAACQILGAKPHFFDYAHEKLMADAATFEAVSLWLKSIQPDIVVTHWPLDTHPNHHVTSSLAWQCYLREGTWNLYFFEVMTDQQTKGFRPELYLDIETVHEIKQRACFRHESQKPDSFWLVHEAMHRRRGEECGVKSAEAYFLVEARNGRPLLPVSFLPRKK